MTSQSVKNIIRLDTDASWICSCLETWQRWDLVSFRHQKKADFPRASPAHTWSQWKPHSSTWNSFRENDILQRLAWSTTLNGLGWTNQAASTGLIKTNMQCLYTRQQRHISWPKVSPWLSTMITSRQTLAIQFPYMELICYWVVQCNREPWEGIWLSRLSHNICRGGSIMSLMSLPCPRRYGTSKKTHICKDFCSHNTV